jgi:hypothetical protein
MRQLLRGTRRGTQSHFYGDLTLDECAAAWLLRSVDSVALRSQRIRAGKRLSVGMFLADIVCGSWTVVERAELQTYCTLREISD